MCKSSFCINAKNNQGLLNKIDFNKVIIFYLNKNKNIKLNVQPFCTFEDENVNIFKSGLFLSKIDIDQTCFKMMKKQKNRKFYMLFCLQNMHTGAEQCFFITQTCTAINSNSWLKKKNENKNERKTLVFWEYGSKRFIRPKIQWSEVWLDRRFSNPKVH